MSMVKIGLIGAGRMGKCHADVLAEMPQVKLNGVYDVDPVAAQFAAGQYGMQIHHGVDALAQSREIDAVMICSPSYCHEEGIMAAIKAGKPVFCEKPLCRTDEAADRIVAAVRNYGSVFTVGLVRRHVPLMKKYQELLAAGLLGRVRVCNVDLMLGSYRRMRGDWFADFNACGGVILDMLAHHLDLLNWFFGDVERVYAKGLLLDPELPEPADYVSATVTYRNRVICNISCGWQRFGRNSDYMEVYGDTGCLSYSWGGGELLHYPQGAEMEQITLDNALESPYKRQMRDWIECITTGRPPVVSFADGHRSFQVASAMIKSAQTGKEICC